jgi:DNA-binding MarR family transcriptional regulator
MDKSTRPLTRMPMAGDADPASTAAMLLVQLAPRVLVAMRAGLRQAETGGLTVPQVRVLRYVRRHPNASLGELAEYLYISAPSASALVNRLTRQGLLLAEIPAEDRRRVRLTLTAAGEAALARATALSRDEVRARLQSLPPDVLAAVVAALEPLLGRFD